MQNIGKVYPILIGVVCGLLFVGVLQSFAVATEDVQCFTNEKTNECITWDKTHLTYHISNQLDEKYADYYRWAFSTWQYWLDGTLTFGETKYSSKADIQIKITEDGSCSGALGCTELQNDKEHFTDVYIYASNKECKEGETFSTCISINDRSFWLTAQHETGHALGLAHTQDNLEEPVDIMYYKIVPELMIISQDDVRKIGQMYGKSNIVEMELAPYDMFGDQVQFIPDRITIKVGETVTWINEDDTGRDRNLHTVTSGTPQGEWGEQFDSGNKAMRPDDSFSVTFTEKGEYPYLCRLHPWMIGKVVVN